MTLSEHPEIVLSKESFEKIKHAKECLTELFSFEEKYELLLANYLELEKECLLISSENMINRNTTYKDFFEIRLLFNQRVVNLLTTAKLYLDQIEQHIKFCSKNTKIKPLLSAEYDNNFEYRFMEALRNYVQHRGLAVHATSLDRKWISSEDDAEMQISTKVFTLKVEVSKDRAFKKSVSEEMPEKVNLVFSARSYLESISKVHCEIREKLTDIADSARKSISSLINDYEKLNDGKSLGLCIIQMENDEIVEKIHITMEWENIRLELIKKNQFLVNLKKRFVSNSIQSKK